MTKRRPAPFATTFGNPRPVRSRRFYEIANAVLPVAARIIHFVNVTLAFAFVALLVYVGVFVEHEEIWVSDGTVFSCRVDALKPVPAKARK